MKFCEQDEVKICPERIGSLHFGRIDESESFRGSIDKLLRVRGTILESDFQKNIYEYKIIINAKGEKEKIRTGKKGMWTHFVEFKDIHKTREWFLDDELLLI